MYYPTGPTRARPSSVNALLESGEIKSLPTPFEAFLRRNSYPSVRLRDIRALLTFSVFRSYLLGNYGPALYATMAEPRAIGLQYVHRYVMVNTGGLWAIEKPPDSS
jgi:hypothetical protein